MRPRLDPQGQPSNTVVLAYRSDGFPLTGGIRRVAEGLATTLELRGWTVATLQLPGSSSSKGLLLQTRRCPWPQPEHTLLILGCDQPWAYGLALWRRSRWPLAPLGWLPSFHDPAKARHPGRAYLAAQALRTLQRMGVVVFAQTHHEQQLLDGGRCRLSSHALPAGLRQLLKGDTPRGECPRDVDLLFVGRPTRQKGWDRFLALVARSRLRAAALVPVEPPGPEALPPGLKLILAANDACLRRWLRRSKLLIVPSVYESLGLAQLEAVGEGCLVPVFGHWPFWPEQPTLHWQASPVEQVAARCARLCHDDSLRHQLRCEQRAALRDHPMLDAPMLPGLLDP